LIGLALGKTTTTGVRCVVRQSKTEVGSRIGSVGKRIQVVGRITYLLHKLKTFPQSAGRVEPRRENEMAYNVTMKSKDNEYSFTANTAQEVRDLVANSYRVTSVKIVDDSGEKVTVLNEDEIFALLGINDK